MLLDKSIHLDKRRQLKKLLSRIQHAMFQPFAFLACLNFSVRRVVFGGQNAMNYLESLDSISQNLILKSYGAKIGKNCDIQPGITFHNCKNFKNLTIGNNCHIGKNCFFDLRAAITIQDNVVISMCSKFVTHIDMTKSSLSVEFPAKSAPIIIGESSYLGIGSTVLMGVELGSRVLVGANSLVNDSFPDDSRVAGTPCQPIVSKNSK